MSRDELDQPSLERSLSEYFSQGDGQPRDLSKLLAERPDLAEQLRQVLEEHDRSINEATRIHNPHAIEVAQVEGDLEAQTILPSSRDTETLSGRVSKECQGGQFGDYDLLEEIARGGMGVVYRARQISLDRIVALKMILAGQLAGEDEVARFYAEAESAARLSHPGIVPIIEVGQHDNQHFFAMGLIEGSSLADRLREGPLDCLQAAEITTKIADAVEYAHRHGVIHRDLKPANVLLSADGEPHITDFGLAKRVDHDSQLTATGQVLGTPSYMPPEQANGQLDQICPASDVYALGAILYAMLTGRAPFQAASPIDTLMQVLERDPPPPRQLNSEVDRDLETICLKCLQKEIPQRYANAREVVEEIERFQRGEPLIARPVSPWELLRRWRTRLRDNKVVRVRSSGGIGKLPWVDIAVGPDTETGQTHGVARGVIAIGDKARGLIAVGDSAIGLVAFGKSCVGLVAVGVRAIGLISFAAFGLGLISLSAVSVGVVALGAVAAGWVSFGGLVVGQYSLGAIALGTYGIGIGRRDTVAIEFFGGVLGRMPSRWLWLISIPILIVVSYLLSGGGRRR